MIIIAAGGVNAENATDIISRSGCMEIHASARQKYLAECFSGGIQCQWVQRMWMSIRAFRPILMKSGQ